MSGGGKQLTDGAKKDRWVKTREFCREFWEKNPGASSHAAMKALNNARLDDPPFIVAEEHKLYLERLALKTNATASMLSMQIHPARPEVLKGPRLVTPPKEEEPTMADPKTNIDEKTEITRCARELQAVMAKYGIESLILTCTTAPKPHVDVDLTYKKANAWSVDL